MQLKRGSARARLGAAAGALLALGAPAAARALPVDGTPRWHADLTGLLYSESARTRVIEPIARITRLFNDGQSVTARFGLDTMTGATPSGGLPSDQVQTTTSPSGNRITLPAGQVPLRAFKDTRVSLDLEGTTPFWRVFKATTGVHLSDERDYRSFGLNGALSLDVMNRLATLTVGGAFYRDTVDPMGGTHVGLADGTVTFEGPNPKRVNTVTLGLSRILTRRWMMEVTASRTNEHGYLTDPYKVVSLFNPTTGHLTGELTELRPGTRQRSDVQLNSVYHLAQDVTYTSYRYYRDDWGVRSHTLDLRYRHDIDEAKYIQPHLRYYTQRAADFFTYGLKDGAPLPAHASGDYRLGPLRTLTVGLKYGFKVPNGPGEISLRGEYMEQFGDGHPASAVGVQKGIDLFPPEGITSLVVAYSVDW